MPLWPTRLIADRNMIGNTIDLYCFQKGEDGKGRAGQPIEMRPHDANTAADPIARISRNEAQELLDSLYHCGLRPTQEGDSVGALAATQNHLEDMRKIAFRALHVK